MGKPAAHGRESLKLISPERPVIAGYASVAVETQLSQAEATALAKPATAGLFRCGSRHADMAVTGERR